MKKKLRILLLADSLFMLAGGLFGPIYAIFVEGIGGDILTAGSAYAAFSVASGLLMLIISKMEDRFKNKEKLIVVGYIMSCTGFLGYMFIRNPIDLFIVQIIFGFGEAINIPAFDGVYSKSLEKGKYISGWGLWESMNYVIEGTAALFGGAIALIFGFGTLFSIMFILSLIGLVISSFLIARK